MSVYRPEDAGRDSSDIPCTFGVMLSPRDSMLHITVVMRSNNAWILLPYNVFEFTLLGELIAGETGMALGSYFHFAVSMHLYENHFEAARQGIGTGALQLEAFPEMPPESLRLIRDLCIWESSIRHRHKGLTKRDVQAELRNADKFGEFCKLFARVVLAKALLNAKKLDLAKEVSTSTRGPLGQLLRHELGVEQDLGTAESHIPTPTEVQLEQVHHDRSTQSVADRTTAEFYLMMIRDQLSEPKDYK